MAYARGINDLMNKIVETKFGKSWVEIKFGAEVVEST